MITLSDNTATNLLLDKLDIATVNAKLDALGLTGTRMHSKTFRRQTSIAPDSSARYGLGVAVPDEMVRLFALLHGEAVGAGMALAFAHSAKLGLCTAQDSERVRRHLASAGFELDITKLPGAPFDADDLVRIMAHDKKAEAGKLTLILARAIGQSFVQKDPSASALRAFLAESLH
jgi:hypothetical protein